MQVLSLSAFPTFSQWRNLRPTITVIWKDKQSSNQTHILQKCFDSYVCKLAFMQCGTWTLKQYQWLFSSKFPSCQVLQTYTLRKWSVGHFVQFHIQVTEHTVHPTVHYLSWKYQYWHFQHNSTLTTLKHLMLYIPLLYPNWNWNLNSTLQRLLSFFLGRLREAYEKLNVHGVMHTYCIYSFLTIYVT